MGAVEEFWGRHVSVSLFELLQAFLIESSDWLPQISVDGNVCQVKAFGVVVSQN